MKGNRTPSNSAIGHIKGSDPVTIEGDLHLLECWACQHWFPNAHWFAQQRFARTPVTT